MDASVSQRVRDMVLAYEGGDTFLLSLRSWALAGRALTPKQVDAALRVLARLDDQRSVAKTLWRDVLQAAHPDRATDDGDRRWRHRFSVLANRAHDDQDVPALVWLRALVVDDDAG